MGVSEHISAHGLLDALYFHPAGTRTHACLRERIQAGANLAERDRRRRTPLLVASSQGDITAAGLLLAAGANRCATDSVGAGALHLAADSGGGEMVRYLIHEQGFASVLNALDGQFRAPIHYAINAGQVEAFEVLLDAGADIEKGIACTGNTYFGLSALHWAVQRCRHVMAKRLIDAGADIELPLGHRPLKIACAHAAVDSAAVLIDAGAEVDGCDSLGDTALFAACEYQCLEAVELLLAAGANPAKTNTLGVDAYEHARRERAWDALALLEANRQAQAVESELSKVGIRTPSAPSL